MRLLLLLLVMVLTGVLGRIVVMIVIMITLLSLIMFLIKRKFGRRWTNTAPHFGVIRSVYETVSSSGA